MLTKFVADWNSWIGGRDLSKRDKQRLTIKREIRSVAALTNLLNTFVHMKAVKTRVKPMTDLAQYRA